MTVAQALQYGYARLHKTTPSHFLDAQLLLSHAVRKPREFLFTYPETSLTARQTLMYRAMIRQRQRHKPVAYITHEKEWYGVPFYVDSGVLIPRPETELLAEHAIHFLQQYISAVKNARHIIIDVGTGSACIPVAIMKNIHTSEHPRLTCVATDISDKARRIAQRNISKHRLRNTIKILKGSLLAPILHQPLIRHDYDTIIITANLAYLPDATYPSLAPDIQRYEPKTALLGGEDGLKYYKRLIPQIQQLLGKVSPRHAGLFFEIDPSQKKAMLRMIRQQLSGFKTQCIKDGCHKNRLIVAEM